MVLADECCWRYPFSCIPAMRGHFVAVGDLVAVGDTAAASLALMDFDAIYGEVVCTDDVSCAEQS